MNGGQGGPPITSEEYERQMAEYNRQMQEYERQMATYNRLYGGQQAQRQQGGQMPQQSGQMPQQGGQMPQGQYPPGPQGQYPPLQGGQIQGEQGVSQQGVPQQGVPQQPMPPQPPQPGMPQGMQQGMQQPQQGQNQQGKLSLKDKLKKLPIKKMIPGICLVLIAIGVVGSMFGGGGSTPAPSSKSPKPSSSSTAPAPAPSSSSAPSAPTPSGTDKDKASIDRVPTPGNTESLGNLMELYNEVVFPSVLSVPDPEPVVDKTTVNLGGSYVFRPNRNWSSRVDGNTITLVHDDGIVAKFIFNKNKKTLKPDEMKSTVFPEFLAGFGITEPVYDEIFYNTTLSGVSTRIDARFNDQPLVLEVGMVTCNREVLTYVIAYYDSSEVYQSEIVESLLNTITWKSSNVTFAR